MLTVETRYATDPVSARAFDSEALRQHFHLGGLFAPGEIRLVYSHYDRMIVGAAVPDGGTLRLDAVKECGTDSILQRREMGILNLGARGIVRAASVDYTLESGEILYLGKGAGPIDFTGEGRFYLLSTPAHASHPNRQLKREDAQRLELGTQERANRRTIYQFIHPEVMPSCQLVMGYTQLDSGSVWNTMPAHRHDRRMEAYLYFDLPAEQRVFHFMGEPQQSRHLLMANEEAVLSPPWSIHCGAGTASYSFCWGMAGDNTDYRDQDMVPMEALR